MTIKDFIGGKGVVLEAGRKQGCEARDHWTRPLFNSNPACMWLTTLLREKIFRMPIEEDRFVDIFDDQEGPNIDWGGPTDRDRVKIKLAGWSP